MLIKELIFQKGKVNVYLCNYNKKVTAHLYFYNIYITLINKEYIELFLILVDNN